MYAKQYEITLPADYDMDIVRRRVAAAGPPFDGRAGLGLKAFVIRERGADGSPVNQYAPFYLWNELAGMKHFLFGHGGFERIVESFGRPSVLTWTGLGAAAGPARAATPRAASRRLTRVPADLDTEGDGLTAFIEQELQELRAFTDRDGVHTAALAVDPRTWELVRFALWEDAVPAGEDATERYEVLHVSATELDALPKGRAW